MTPPTPRPWSSVIGGGRRQPRAARAAAGAHRGRRQRRRPGRLDRLAGPAAGPARRRGPGRDGARTTSPEAPPRRVPGGGDRRHRRQRRRGGAARRRPHPLRRPPGGRVRPGPARPVRRHRGAARRVRPRGPDGDPAHLRGHRGRQWQVESPGGDAPDAAALARGLRRLADGDRSPLQSLERRRTPSRTASALAASGSPGQTRAMVVPHASEDATVIEVRAVDRVGLLHEIGMTLRPGRAERPQRPHRHLRGADARHVLRHRVRRPEPAAGPRGAGGVHADRRVRRSAVPGKITLSRVHQPL